MYSCIIVIITIICIIIIIIMSSSSSSSSSSPSTTPLFRPARRLHWWCRRSPARSSEARPVSELGSSLLRASGVMFLGGSPHLEDFDLIEKVF